MNIELITPGKSFPDDFNVIIEISAHSDPIKFEYDKKTNSLFVDRFMGTSMSYPANYGFVPNTLSGDGDPCDVLVVSPFTIPPNVVIRSRALGVLHMEDDGGKDTKIIAVPITKICPMYENIKKLEDLPLLLRNQIKHFFEHYKDLEKNKWVKIKGWGDEQDALLELQNGINNLKKIDIY